MKNQLKYNKQNIKSHKIKPIAKTSRPITTGASPSDILLLFPSVIAKIVPTSIAVPTI